MNFPFNQFCNTNVDFQSTTLDLTGTLTAAVSPSLCHCIQKKIGYWLVNNGSPSSLIQTTAKIYEHTHIYMYTYTYIYICRCMICVQIHIYICTYTYILTYTYIYIHIYIHIYIYIYIYIYTSLSSLILQSAFSW